MKTVIKNSLLVIFFNLIISSSFAHDSNYENIILKTWEIKGQKNVSGSFYMINKNTVFIENENNQIIHFPLNSFSKRDQNFILDKKTKIQRLNNQILSQNTFAKEIKRTNTNLLYFIVFLIVFACITILSKLKNKAKIVYSFLFLGFCFSILSFVKKTKQLKYSLTSTSFIDSAFVPFKPDINTFWDANYFYVESNGIPTTHEMMVGISNHGWQQQVPIPQCYTGSNAWSIPLNPVISSSPIPVNANHFSRGAIAIAVNGVAIFNPYTNTGVDAFLDGQLDNYGGHCGRADDYHYHTAPLHLYNHTSDTLPIAFGLDGFAVYGATEPDGTAMQTLDANHGHLWNNGVYHYHGSAGAPYMIANMVGVVTEDTTHQIIPQAAAHGIRPPLTPLSGALITSCTPNSTNNGYNLTYTLNGSTDSVVYNWTSQGLYTYNFYTSTGLTTQTYNKTAPCTINATSGLLKKGDNKGVSIFPNPTNDVIKIQISTAQMLNDFLSINIYTSTGELVYNSNQFKSTIDVKDFKNGVYILKVKFKNYENVSKVQVY